MKYHFIGIGGIGMSALANICLDRESKVSGSDLSLNPYLEELKKRGAIINEGHRSTDFSDDVTIVYSSAISKENIELQQAEKLKLKILHRSDLLASLMQGSKTLAVAGTHGKTTTSSLLTHVLLETGRNPSFAIGGILKSEKTNGRSGKGDYFVAEADESDGTFLKYNPFGAIVTSVGKEHLDFFQTEENLYLAFYSFLSNVSSGHHLFYCVDDKTLRTLAKGKGISYGFSPDAALKIENYCQSDWKIFFDLTFHGKSFKNIELSLVGKHNASNAAAVFGLCLQLGIEESFIRKAFQNFSGVKRRCDIKGDSNGVLVIDDYGHHPTEIAATLRGIRQAIKGRRMIVIFQPHRYTRTRDHLDTFGQAFGDADILFLTDIYAASEKPIENITKERLAEKIQNHNEFPVFFCSNQPLEQLRDIIRPHDVVVTIGAGNITHLSDKIAQGFSQSPPRKYRVGIIEGGRSCEHEVSLRSAQLVKDSLDPLFYEQTHFLINKEGEWSNSLYRGIKGKLIPPQILEEIYQCDILFPIMHGPFCEDGTLQGFFEMIDKPYVGSDFRGCAISMDKALSKILVSQAGVSTAPFVSFDEEEWKIHQKELESRIDKEINYPLYVKPIHLGSTVGVKRVGEKKDLQAAIAFGFKYDTHLMVEKSMEGCRELEFPVIGKDLQDIEVPPPGEIFISEMAYDYKGKYGANPIRKAEKADISDELIKKGQKVALKAYRACGCNGMARVDFFLDAKGNYWFIEINPIPGMTPKSLFTRIFKNKLGSFGHIYDRLIVLALQRERIKQRHMKLDVTD